MAGETVQKAGYLPDTLSLSVKKKVLVQNLSHEDLFDLHENEPIEETHFQMKDFAGTRCLREAKVPLNVAWFYCSVKIRDDPLFRRVKLQTPNFHAVRMTRKSARSHPTISYLSSFP